MEEVEGLNPSRSTSPFRHAPSPHQALRLYAYCGGKPESQGLLETSYLHPMPGVF